jgi:hypothetical protein
MTDDLTCSGCGEYIGSHISDRIEAQAAEIERLREIVAIMHTAFAAYADSPAKQEAINLAALEPRT